MVLRKRFAQNYLVNLNYTYSRWIDTTETGYQLTGVHQDSDHTGVEKALSNYDRRNVLTASWVWEVPWLRQHDSPVVRNVLGGWEVTGLVGLADGRPFTVRTGRDNSLTGNGQDRPNLVGNPNLPTDRPRGELVAKYFDTAAFQPNPTLTFGNTGRNILIGPGVANVDFGFIKNVHVTESQQVQFRSEFFNLFNRPNFGFPVSNVSSGTFGRIFSADPARQIQFALKYIF